MLPAHVPAVRDAIRELGYGGLTFTGSDLAADVRQLQDQLAAASGDLDRGMLQYALGAAERKRGDCGAAIAAWGEARKLLLQATHVTLDTPDVEQRRNQAFRHYGRSMLGIGLCELAAGNALAAEKSVSNGVASLFGVSESERAGAQLAWAIAMWETGKEQDGRDLVLIAGRRGDAALRATIEAYLTATGWTLR
jgi:hypothetical protein